LRATCLLPLVSWPSVERPRPKERPAGRTKRWSLDLFWCCAIGKWRSLAVPAPLGCRAGDLLELSIACRWTDDEHGSWDDIGLFTVKLPESGEVAVQHWCQGERHQSLRELVPILDFVGHGQVDAVGGIDALRGEQHPMQFATEDVMISFLLYVPQVKEPRPLLIFFHGDMPRGAQECPQPGLADFIPTYGPAMLVSHPKKETHPCREFVVVTPCCSNDVWWLRYPAEHDSTAYASSVEDCMRGIVAMIRDIGLSPPNAGACLVGQSMGAYMALELARAMPENTAAVAAGAPCFDACRLDHLARRLVNVPVWLLIGRNDSMCSFEECASLALKMRDLDAKCVRLTSQGIKGHSEVGKKLEKWDLYQWLRDPLA